MTPLRFLRPALAALLMVAPALPAQAAVDVPALTCGQFAAADGPGKDAYGRAVLLWAQNTRNWRQAGTLPAQFVNDTKKDVRQKIARACFGKPDSANVVAELLKGVTVSAG